MPQVGVDLTGPTVLITGAAGDLGRATALRLAATGARLALTDTESAFDGLEQTRAACALVAGEGAVMVVTADVTDARSVQACFATVTQTLGVPDRVFNNAGVQGALVPLPDYPLDDLQRVMAVNVVGAFHVLREAARGLRMAARGGSVVNSASMAGVDGAANMSAYSASKAAILGLTRAAAKDLAPLGIRVNAVSPAFIGPGRMWDRQVELQARAASQYFSTDPAEVAREMLAMVPMRRTGTPDEVAATVAWLLSDESSYVTGQNIIISGGI